MMAPWGTVSEKAYSAVRLQFAVRDSCFLFKCVCCVQVFTEEGPETCLLPSGLGVLSEGAGGTDQPLLFR